MEEILKKITRPTEKSREIHLIKLASYLASLEKRIDDLEFIFGKVDVRTKTAREAYIETAQKEYNEALRRAMKEPTPQKECGCHDNMFCSDCTPEMDLTKGSPQKTDWDIEQHAAERFLKGKKNHPDQVWSEMTPEVRVAEALEELADTWNYCEDFKNREEIRNLLKVTYDWVKREL